MKLHLTNAEVGMWNAEGWCRFAQSFFKIDRIHHFDIHDSIFDIRFFRVSFSNKLVALAAGSRAEPLNAYEECIHPTHRGDHHAAWHSPKRRWG